MKLGLHQVTANELDPIDLIELAASVGCEEVCLFTHIPAAALPDDAGQILFPLVTPEKVVSTKSALDCHGIAVGNAEFFPIAADVDVEIYRSGFEVAAAIGARSAVTHVHDPDDARAVAGLGRLCDLAAEYDLRLGLEFMGITPACASIERAAWFVQQVGRANIGIGVDALHLVRTGGTPADVLKVPASLFAYAQICDGAGLHVTQDYFSEAFERMLPGDGDFPLADLVAALPVGIAVDVEVPSAQRIAANGSPLDFAREAVGRSRELLAAIGKRAR
ncbi:sugar phosphate isomerase/epimerase [Novosphingobium sp. G106]|uniref:sugar phosphate isomerase/epimerase family protein n=1 Tax=Novosphingobium sp. G106 TaxID=2849500 RepID=UPI001C2D6380|nr:sugar phosphate isomerase/epimerase [Novosphingobium sp. G106]MBV1689505.1 sugar phosphate isomerase/epimerase [Novosphingobium sp. G106]